MNEESTESPERRAAHIEVTHQKGPSSPDERSSGPRSARRPLRIREILLALGPAIVAIGLGALAFDGVTRAGESRGWVTHSRDVLQRTSATLSALQDAETGQRGYVITGDTTYLAPYERALAALREDTLALRTLTLDNPVQQRRLDTLGALTRRKLSELAGTIETRRSVGLEPAVGIVRADSGKRIMDSIRVLLDRIVGDEQRLLERRETDEESRGVLVSVILIAGTIAAALLSLLITGRLLRFARTQARLAEELTEQNRQLESQSLELEMQAQQLQEQATELEMQNEELRTTTEDLEHTSRELVSANTALIERTSAAEAAREAADAANAAKSNFLAMMSHELRTPLNAIAGYAQLMQLGVPEPVPQVHLDYLARIQQSQYHLLGVINSVLNFARVEAGTVSYDITDVFVGTLLAAVEPLIAPQVSARGHSYVCEPCDRTLVVRADADKAMQILLNLLSNSIKFTPAGGTITLAAEALDGFAAIRVRDTGPGIPEDKQGVIFDPFLQLDTSRTRTSEGTGLGLSISRNLARGMGGDLVVESTLGLGSTFTLTLPRAR
jgi:signal transduction histidine kinase